MNDILSNKELFLHFFYNNNSSCLNIIYYELNDRSN